MATHKSAIKRARQNTVRNLRNAAIPIIQKAAQKGALHRKSASRKISRLTRQVNAISAS
ncbi:MAG: 30S ribosomal protein S20 [Deltaproteobacteria bacterium]|nr:30S ribosomal protein S20 [Deltaproteobacteria bacterium]